MLADSLSFWATPTALLISLLDHEAGAACAGIFSYYREGNPSWIAWAPWAAASLGCALRSAILYSVAWRCGWRPQRLIGKSNHLIVTRYLHRNAASAGKLFMIVGALQFCFAFRWSLPALCARSGMNPVLFFTASLVGSALWSGVIATSALFGMQLYFPGFLGWHEAREVLPGLILLAALCAGTARIVIARLLQRVRNRELP